MKLFLKTILIITFFMSSVFAETFMMALKRAYDTNPELNAERENLNISKQELNISKGAYLPTITLSGSKSQEDTDKLTNRNGTDASINDVDPTTKSITITQTLIDLGRGAELAKSKIGIDLVDAKLLKKEQEILYKSIEAYTGLISANEKLKINKSNVNLLDRQVETDRIRLERGQISLSDVAQSESSLAGAQAKLIQAENDFLTSKLNYENIIGSINDPETLDKKSIKEVTLPEQLNSAIEISIKNNPDLKIIAAHILSMSNDIDAVAQRLEAYPNLSVELGARFGDLAMQDSDKVRNFFDKYRDRILFGTDYGTGEAEDQKSSEELLAEAKNLEERYQLLFDYLTKQDSMVLRKQQTKGLALSKSVLEKIFSKNYLKFLTRSN